MRRVASELPPHPACPHCASDDTELTTPFGSVLAVAQYYCRACRTPFEFVK